MISYIQVLDVFKAFAQGHLQIQKFDFEFREQMPNLATVDEAYPMLFVVPVGGSTLENVREFDVDVYCVDRYQKNRSNVNYVISDTDLILGDLTRWLEEGQDDIEVVRTYTTTPINNDLLDYVGGHVMRMRVQVDRIALCEIPFDGEQPTPPTCPSAIVRNSDGTWSDIVASGGTYIVPDTPVTVTDQDGNPLGSDSLPSVTGGNIQVTIDPSGDGEAVLLDTDGNVLSTTPVPPETTVNIVAPDSDYEIRKSNNAILYQGTILSGGALVQNIQDSTVRVRKSNNQVIQDVTVRAESIENYNVADSTAVLKDTDGTIISTTQIRATESEDITAPDGTVENSTGSYSDTVVSGGTLILPDETINLVDEFGNPISTFTFPVYTDPNIDITSYCPAPADATAVLKDTLGNTLSTTNIPSGTSDDIIAPDADVENSDASYTASVESGGVLVLPDSDVNVNGNLEGTVVSVQPIDIDVTDGTNPVTPDAITISGNTVTIEVPAAGGAPVGATLMKTGQTTSYRTGDDGDIEAGRATDFFTLASNNPFGNTDRFTDELGGTAYANDIVIDWSTFDGSTVLGWRRVENGVNIPWANAIDGALAVSIGTFTSGWRLPNFLEMASLFNANENIFGNSSPAPWTSVLPSGILWTSTTSFAATNNALAFNVTFPQFTRTSKTTSTSMRYIPCRTFTVTGTTLT
jgi:hypothetical protein